MKSVIFMRSTGMPWVRAVTAVVWGCCLVSCTNTSTPVSESQYATKIVGRWQGTVGELKETMSIDEGGTFVCQLRPLGFIANTLSQGVTGTIRGTWKISGASINLSITSAENEMLKNKVAASTIVSFKEDELVLKSNRGETSMFRRVSTL